MILKSPFHPAVGSAIPEDSLPACLTRDRLTSAYMPNTSRAVVALTAVLCGVFALTSLNRLHHTDLWSHLAIGRWIDDHAALPSVDPFAITENGREMIATAWLSQWIGYRVHQALGNEGLIFGHALLVTLSCAAVAYAIRIRGAGWGWCAAGAAIAFVLGLPIEGVIRPQLFGQALFPLVLCGVSLLEQRYRLPMFCLPILFAMWANLHGSFPMGLAAMGLFTIGMVRYDRAIAVRSGITLLLCLLATLLTPHGLRLWPEVAGFGKNPVLATISEWQAVSWNSKLTLVLLAGSTIAGACVFVPRRRSLRDYEWLMLALFAIAVFAAVRMLAWWAVVAPWILVPHAAAMLEALQKHRRPEAMNTLIAVSLVFMTLLASPASQSLISGRDRGISATVSDETPIYIAAEIERRELVGSFFAPTEWADYLVWSSHARMRPLASSQVHLLDAQSWSDQANIAAGTEDWEAIARRHELRYVLIPRRPDSRKLHDLAWKATLDPASNVRVAYQDRRCLLVELLPKRM